MSEQEQPQAVVEVRRCPGVSGPECGNEAAPGDIYCEGCRYWFEGLPEDIGVML